MNRQVLILIIGGLFAALMVALLVQSMIGGKSAPAPTEAAAIPTTQVLIAARALNIGDDLTANMVKWQDWPQNALFPGAITRASVENPDDPLPITGQLKRSLAAGEPIMRSALIEDTASNFLASSLREGMRAMAITVNAQSSVAGFITPGDFVDIILTHTVRLPAGQDIRDASRSVVSQMTSQTILENIRVIAVDQEAKERKEIKLFKTVTVELSPKQVEELALAQSMGELSLSLRRIGDASIPETSKATTDVRMSRVMQELMGEENTSGVNNRIVRIYNGSNVEDLAVRPYPAQ